MDPLTILSLVATGVKIISSLVQPGGAIASGADAASGLLVAGGPVDRAITAVRRLTDKAPEEVTDQDLDEVEQELDALLDEFNLPMPSDK